MIDEHGSRGHVEPSPIDLINYCLQHEPEALGLLFLSYRVQSVHFKKLPLPKSSCYHVPSGVVDPAGAISGCDCGKVHASWEKCSACGEWVDYHGFKGRESRVAVVEFELPERIGINLQLEPADRDFFFSFAVERAAHARAIERMNNSSRIIRPA